MNKVVTDFSPMAMNYLGLFNINANIIEMARENIRKNDVAHYFDHVSDVICNAHRIASTQTCFVDVATDEERYKIVRQSLLGALLHDTACWRDRATHHWIAAEWVYGLIEDRAALEHYGLSVEDVIEVTIAIREHRASWEGERKHLVSEIVAAADRGSFEITECLRRSYLFGRFNKNLNKAEATHHAAMHIGEKYGAKGYVYDNLPNFCLKANADNIKALKLNADAHQLKIAIIMKNRDSWEEYYQEVLNARDRSQSSAVG